MRRRARARRLRLLCGGGCATSFSASSKPSAALRELPLADRAVRRECAGRERQSERAGEKRGARACGRRLRTACEAPFELAALSARLRAPFGLNSELRPMPRLVLRSRTRCRGRTACEIETARVRREPGERGRGLELLGQRACAGRCDVDRSAGVVLAESRRGVHFEDGLDVLTRRELVADQIGLMTARCGIRRRAGAGRPSASAAAFICRHARAVSGASRCMRPENVRLDVFELLRFRVAGAARDRGRSRSVFRGRRRAPN